MVEVVGTAPTSVMVITKFVYRRSWKIQQNQYNYIIEFFINFLIKAKPQYGAIYKISLNYNDNKKSKPYPCS